LITTDADLLLGMSNTVQGEEDGRFSRWKSFLDEEVTKSWGDAVLLLSCYVTGLLDSAVFNVWSCFVSMQTGE
jgi:Protein of unknown function (DUF1275)